MVSGGATPTWGNRGAGRQLKSLVGDLLADARVVVGKGHEHVPHGVLPLLALHPAIAGERARHVLRDGGQPAVATMALMALASNKAACSRHDGKGPFTAVSPALTSSIWWANWD